MYVWLFFIVLALNLFIFQGNILDNNYATLDSFLPLPLDTYFLIPAITMRTFADENKAVRWNFNNKTISDAQIVMGKYWAVIFCGRLLFCLPSSILLQ